MINSRIPTLLRFNDEANEYSFDLSEFDDNTLSVLNEYVQQFTANNIPAPTRFFFFLKITITECSLFSDVDKREENQREEHLQPVLK